ncbi:MAG: WG repeat-containing protein [Bacteroidales bacterium]
MSKRFWLSATVLTCIFLIHVGCSRESDRMTVVSEIPVSDSDSTIYINTDGESLFTGRYQMASLIREGYGIVENGGRYGFIDSSGEFILSNVYKNVSIFKDGVAWVVRKGDAPGMINRKGELKFTLRDAVEVEIFYEELARFSVKEGRRLRYGFVSKSGKKIVPPIYYGATRFSEEVASVEDMNGKWGYIDKTGEVIIPALYDEASSFREGLAVVRTGDRYGVIDKKGQYKVKPVYENLVPDGEIYMASEKGVWGWCDNSGKWIIKPEYKSIYPFYVSELAPVMIDGRWGYVNRAGKVQIKRQFDEAYPFVGELALVKIGVYYGFINKEGRYEINPQYTWVSPDYISNAIYGDPYFKSVLSDIK